jgi:hypothetical protein
MFSFGAAAPDSQKEPNFVFFDWRLRGGGESSERIEGVLGVFAHCEMGSNGFY